MISNNYSIGVLPLLLALSGAVFGDEAAFNALVQSDVSLSSAERQMVLGASPEEVASVTAALVAARTGDKVSVERVIGAMVGKFPAFAVSIVSSSVKAAPAMALSITAAAVKAAPSLAPSITAAVVALVPDQAEEVVKVAVKIAPSQAAEIVLEAKRAAPEQSKEIDSGASEGKREASEGDDQTGSGPKGNNDKVKPGGASEGSSSGDTNSPASPS